MGESAPAGGLRVFQSQHSRRQGGWMLDVPRAGGSDAADVPGQYAADAMVPGLHPEHRDGIAAVGQGVRHDVAACGKSGGNRQAVSARTEYSEHHRADQLLDVSSLMDGMSDHDHKMDVDNHPPTADERELREYPLDLAAVREKLAGKQGKQYWRTLEELSENPHFGDLLHREFPRAASEWDESVDRRDFLKLMGASLALAGMAGCGANDEPHIVPYVKQPEGMILGKPQHYATVMPFGGDALGLLVESHEGRPTKIEGNPDHPASLGATNAFAQAAVLDLYDPHRAKTTSYVGELDTWERFQSAAFGLATPQKAVNGEGLRI